MSYIDVTGKTEEEALARALSQLGMDRDDVSVQILERAKNGFLGIGSAPAKVRVTYGEDEEKTSPVSAKPNPEKLKTERKPTEKPAVPVQKPKVEKPAVKAQEPVQKTQRPVAAVVTETATPIGEEVQDEKADAIRTFLSGLMEKMEVESQVHVYLPEKGRYQVILTGPNLGQIIGRRGETLDAIQQLTSYSVNRSSSGRIRVTLDAENYRAKREESLEHLAHKVALKVVKYRRSVTLEPMNAYERHIIHTALQEEPNVSTGSIGTEPNRRVVVSYER